MPNSTPLAIVFALLAALGYAGAAVLQQREAAAQPPEMAMRARLLVRLFTNRRWLQGFVYDWSSFVTEALALGFGTIVLVAPLMQTGLLFALFFGARVNHRPLRRRDWAATATLVVGLTTFLLVADPIGGILRPAWSSWWPWLITMSIGTALCILIGRVTVGTPRAVSWGCAAAICYGLSGPLTKAVVELFGSGQIITALVSWEMYVLILAAGLGMLCNQSAFQAGHLPASLPIIAIGTPLFSCLIGVQVFAEHLSAHGVIEYIALVVSVLVMVLGVLALARSEGTRQESASSPA